MEIISRRRANIVPQILYYFTVRRVSSRRNQIEYLSLEYPTTKMQLFADTISIVLCGYLRGAGIASFIYKRTFLPFSERHARERQ